MNIWVKSLLAGGIVTLAFYFISQKLNSTKEKRRYTIDYTVNAMPDTVSRHPFSISKIMEVIEKRLEIAGYDYKIKKAGENSINISLFGMTDTLPPFSMLIANGRVQFREMYHIGDLTSMLTVAIEQMNKIDTIKSIKVPVLKNDSLSLEVNELLDKMETDKKKQEMLASTVPLIEFIHPLQKESGGIEYPAEIGNVKLKDTAMVRGLFQHPAVKKASRAGILLSFGQPEKMISNRQADLKVPLYFLKPTDEPGTIVLGNEDVQYANTNFSVDGRPEVFIQFNELGSKRWAYITRKNIGNSIAIVINGTVVSAPRVLSAIEGGSATISGNFTKQECNLLSIGLSSIKLPADLTILNSTVKREKPVTQTGLKLFLLFLCFVICSSLAFLLFKTLKAT